MSFAVGNLLELTADKMYVFVNERDTNRGLIDGGQLVVLLAIKGQQAYVLTSLGLGSLPLKHLKKIK